jgi:hypothetical protein
MTQPSSQREAPSQLLFPTWKVMIFELLRQMSEDGVLQFEPHQGLTPVMERLETVGNIISNYQPSRIHELLVAAKANYIPTVPFSKVLKQMQQVPLGKNEFYTVFDIGKSNFTIVDPKVSEILGMNPVDFDIHNLLGSGGIKSLVHPHDVKHWIRWGSLGYLLLSLPFFSFSSMANCFLLRFRIATSESSIASLRKAEYVTLEQRVYPYFERDGNGIARPTYHFDRWTVFENPGMELSRPYCVTDSSVNPYVNGLFYLLNAHLIGVPLKYVLMLEERQHFDRNKAVANSLNEKIKSGTGLDTNYDERQVSDCFVKTIRTRISAALNLWSARQDANEESDVQAVSYAKQLGLLPVPGNIAGLGYRLIT